MEECVGHSPFVCHAVSVSYSGLTCHSGRLGMLQGFFRQLNIPGGSPSMMEFGVQRAG